MCHASGELTLTAGPRDAQERTLLGSVIVGVLGPIDVGVVGGDSAASGAERQRSRGPSAATTISRSPRAAPRGPPAASPSGLGAIASTVRELTLQTAASIVVSRSCLEPAAIFAQSNPCSLLALRRGIEEPERRVVCHDQELRCGDWRCSADPGQPHVCAVESHPSPSTAQSSSIVQAPPVATRPTSAVSHAAGGVEVAPFWRKN